MLKASNRGEKTHFKLALESLLKKTSNQPIAWHQLSICFVTESSNQTEVFPESVASLHDCEAMANRLKVLL